jgi:tetratricopeptide (TPR) repeat protein
MRLNLFILFLLFAPLISEAKPKTSAEANQDKVAKIYAEAESDYKLQKFDKSLQGFQQVYELTSEPSLLFNIAQCYRQLGRFEEAKKSYQTFLRDVPKHPLRANAQERIKDLDAEIARLAQKGTAVISTQQDPTQILFDGETKGDSPLRLTELEPGEHRITVKKEGFIDFEVVATIKPGEAYELKVPQLMAVVTQQEMKEKTKHRVYFFGAAGLGGLGLASSAGAALSLRLAIKEQNDLKLLDGNGDGIISNKEITAKQTQLDTSKNAAILFGSIAGGLVVSAATSAVIGLVKRAKNNKETNLKPDTETVEVQP